MAHDGFSILSCDQEEGRHETCDTPQNLNTVLNADFVSDLYNVLYCNKYEDNFVNNFDCSQSKDRSRLVNVLKSETKKPIVCDLENSKYLPESVHSAFNSVTPVTHIEIIKSSCRRVAGANRVVPLLTSTLKTGKHGFTDIKLVDIYKSFLSDLGSNESNKKCVMCQKIFLSCTELEHHVRVNHAVNISADQCFVCRKNYIFKGQLEIHLRQIHNISFLDLICKICFMEFSTTMERKAHERKHDEFHSCHLCSKRFSSDYLYQKHLSQHVLQVKANKCEKCGLSYKNVVVLNFHKKRHANLSCLSCKMCFPNDTEFLFHIRDHESDCLMKFLKSIELVDEEERNLEEILSLYDKITEKRKANVLQIANCEDDSIQDCITTMVSAVSQSVDSGFHSINGKECRLCGINVSSEKELLDHRRQFHLRNRTCPFCGKRSRSVSQTWRHMKSHLLKNKMNISKWSVECKKNIELPSEFSRENNDNMSYLKSQQPRKNSRLYSCNICSRKFLYPGSRDNHVLQHSKDKCSSWKCNVCGQVFSHPGLLLTHSSAHEKYLKCQICDKPFLSENALQLHLKTHIGEGKKVFKCGICSIECPTLAGLKAHRRCHTGERPYTCSYCQRMFKRSQAVKKHIQVVHNSGSLQYQACSNCPRMFNSSGNLIRHYLRVHCQVRRFICGVCGSRFSQNQDLRRHFKISHEIDMPNINGSDRKALQEVYVIPDIDMSDKNPHAQKIKAIVAEEKAKFGRLSELLNKGDNKDDSCSKSEVQVINNFSNEGEEETSTILLPVQESVAMGEITMTKLHSKQNDSNKLHNADFGDVKSYNCENCLKNFVEENEYMEHVAERSKSYVCSHCGAVFCDSKLLHKHFNLEHKVSYNVTTNYEESCSKQFENNSVQVFCSMSNILHDDQHNDCEVEKNNTFLTLAQKQEPSSTVVDTSKLTFSNNAGSLAISKPALSYPGNGDRNDISTTFNINGIILQNVIIQPAPTVLQAISLDIQNQECSATSVTPMVTFSTALPVLDNDSSFINLNDVCNMTVSSCMDSINSQNVAEKVIDTGSQTFASEDLSQRRENDSDITLKDNHTQIEKIRRKIGQKNIQHKDTEEKSNTFDGEKRKDECKETKKMKCKYCGETFFNASSLNRHMKTHSEKKPFGCPHCTKFFTERHNLKAHLMTHTGERPFKCEDCGKLLSCRKDVVDHKHMHLGEKPFACEVCDRRFIRRRELIRHKLIHTGEKKHKCPICGATFGRLDQLQLAHLPTHGSTGSQSMHNCSICKKSFRLKSALKRHEILHSGLKKYKCELCKKSFALDVYLKAHMQYHKKRNNHLQCPKCPRRFISEATLEVHERTFHARLKKTLKQNEKMFEGSLSKEENSFIQNGSIELDRVSGANIEVPDVDLNILDTNNCNAVIYLQMTPEDLLNLGVGS